MTDAQNLIIVERAYRGAVEVGYFDILYQALELHRQLNGVDILLRQHASTYALATAPRVLDEAAEKVFAGRARLDDPRGEVGRLLDVGIAVMVQRDDIADLRIAPERIRRGVHIVDDADLDQRWFDYTQILYL